ncbi:MAG: TolC family protein [Elusimicrobiales bacterium]|nr:TolC family protein [Elusimicrobiales bacterium]
MSNYFRRNLFALLMAGLFMCLPAIASAGEKVSISLPYAYSRALSASESLAAKKEGIKQLEAAEETIKAGFRPSASLNGQISKYRNEDSQTNVWLSASYSLFSGMRDYILLKAAGKEKEAGELELAAAKRNLYLNVASAYLNLYKAQKKSAILKEQIKLTEKRISHLKWRADVGRSRKSEVIAAQTQLAQTKAEYTESLASQHSCRQALGFLTGLEGEISVEKPAKNAILPYEEYLKNLETRDDIQAARKKADAYSGRADAEARKAYPSVSLSANYYPVRHPMPNQDRRWYAAIGAELPLYTGGQLAANRENAESKKAAAEIELSGMIRQAKTELSSAYSDCKYAEERYKALEQAARLAAENVRLQEDDYSKMLVTNLDVLSAMTTAQSAKTALVNAEAEMIYAFYRLENIAGISAGSEAK